MSNKQEKPIISGTTSKPVDLKESSPSQVRLSSVDGDDIAALQLPSVQTSAMANIPNKIRFRNPSLVERFQNPVASFSKEEAEATEQSRFALPSFVPGLVLSLIMAVACVIGASGSLRIIYKAAGFEELPWAATTFSSLAFLDVFCLLAPIVALYGGFCLFKLSGRLRFSATVAPKVQRTVICALFVMFNPIVFAPILVAAWHIVPLAGLAIPALPIFASWWIYRLMLAVLSLRRVAKPSFINRQLPALTIAMCYMIPTIIIEYAGIFHADTILGMVQHKDFALLSMNSSYHINEVVRFFSLLFAGSFVAAIGQAVSFLVLKSQLREIDWQMRPFFGHLATFEGEERLVVRTLMWVFIGVIGFWFLIMLSALFGFCPF
jgi:hypothetical protein